MIRIIQYVKYKISNNYYNFNTDNAAPAIIQDIKERLDCLNAHGTRLALDQAWTWQETKGVKCPVLAMVVCMALLLRPKS